MHTTFLTLAVQSNTMEEAIVPMVVCTTMFAMIFGISYLKSRENMALIERGMNPKQRLGRPRLYSNLKWGLLLIGCGTGLILAYILDRSLPEKPGNKTEKRITKKIITDKGDTVTTTDTLKAVAAGKTGAEAKTKHDESVDPDLETLTDEVPASHHGHEEVVINMGGGEKSDTSPLYFALIAIGGGLGLFLSYRIERRDAEHLKKTTGVDTLSNE